MALHGGFFSCMHSPKRRSVRRGHPVASGFRGTRLRPSRNRHDANISVCGLSQVPKPFSRTNALPQRRFRLGLRDLPIRRSWRCSDQRIVRRGHSGLAHRPEDYGSFCCSLPQARSHRDQTRPIWRHHLFYSLDARIVSSSFYAICSVLPALTLTQQSTCEYVFNGVVSGNETLFREVKLAPIQATIVVGPSGLEVFSPRLSVTRVFNWERRDALLRE